MSGVPKLEEFFRSLDLSIWERLFGTYGPLPEKASGVTIALSPYQNDSPARLRLGRRGG